MKKQLLGFVIRDNKVVHGSASEIKEHLDKFVVRENKDVLRNASGARVVERVLFPLSVVYKKTTICYVTQFIDINRKARIINIAPISSMDIHTAFQKAVDKLNEIGAISPQTMYVKQVKPENELKRSKDKKIRFADIAIRYLNAKKNVVRAITYKQYEYVTVHKLKDFHSVVLSNLSLSLIERVFENKFKKNAPMTLKVFKVFKDILNYDFEGRIDPVTIQNIRKRNYSQFLIGKSVCAHHRSLENIDEIRDFYNAIDDIKANELCKLAIKLMMHTALRSKNILKLSLKNVNFDNKELIFQASEMKNHSAFNLPLTDVSLNIIKQAIAINEAKGRVLDKHTEIFGCGSQMYRDNFKKILKLALTPHSARSMFSTSANIYFQEHGVPFEVIERFLAHANNSSVRAAYNHAKHEKEIRWLANWWSCKLIGDQKWKEFVLTRSEQKGLDMNKIAEILM